MPLHVEKLTTEVGFREADLPLGNEQLDALVELVLERLEEQQREQRDRDEATELKRQATRPLRMEG